jgi:hypothetical protein
MRSLTDLITAYCWGLRFLIQLYHRLLQCPWQWFCEMTAPQYHAVVSSQRTHTSVAGKILTIRRQPLASLQTGQTAPIMPDTLLRFVYSCPMKTHRWIHSELNSVKEMLSRGS